MKSHDFLNVLGAKQPVREIEGVRDIPLGEGHRLSAHVLGSGLSGRRLSLERADRLLRGRHESVEGLSRLLDALLGHLPHLRGDLEIGHALLGHRRLPAIALLGRARLARGALLYTLS